MALLSATTVDVHRFMEALSEGEPFAWACLGAIVFFTGLAAYQKYRSFSK